ncbi:MAG: hypothetical protein JO318_08685 [Chloroflexi bacterium]|nr:hypothetical protein [Chloroflexota bacterium]
MMWLGIGICVWAIVVLGRYLRGVVSLEPGRRVVESGPYRLVRHPRVHWWLVGAGCDAPTTGDQLAVLVMAVLAAIGILQRIRVEENPRRRAGRPLSRLHPSPESTRGQRLLSDRVVRACWLSGSRAIGTGTVITDRTWRKLCESTRSCRNRCRADGCRRGNSPPPQPRTHPQPV